MEVIIAVPVKGSTEPLSFGVVSAGHTNGQAHPPVTNIGPNKGPGGKDQLQEKSHTQ